MFPAERFFFFFRSGVVRRHHLHESGLQKAVKLAVRVADIHKRVNSDHSRGLGMRRLEHLFEKSLSLDYS